MEKEQDFFSYFIDDVYVTDSTNNYIRHIPLPPGDDFYIVNTNYQTNGRGQGTNKWESEKGQNLLFSVKCSPYKVKASENFILMQAISLAICKTLRKILRNKKDVNIKWPNDIYYKDKKICGTLTECTLRFGYVHEFIAGIGLNVNQLMFVSDAPNPVSMAAIKHCKFDRNNVLERIIEEICRCFRFLCFEEGFMTIINEYNQCLYRREGFHKYIDANGGFEAKLSDIRPNGHIILERTDGTLSEYEFKEVKFVID